MIIFFYRFLDFLFILFVITWGTDSIFFFAFFYIYTFDIGGYRGDRTQRTKVASFVFFWLATGSVFVLISTYNPKGGLPWVVCCLWTSLFCGGMVMPALAGMYSAAIPNSRLKILGSAIQLVVNNIFAYAACPIVAGHLMRQMEQTMPSCKGAKPGECAEALEDGFRATLYSAPVGVFFCLVLLLGGLFIKGNRMMGIENNDGSDENKSEQGEPLLKKGGVLDADKML